MSCRLCQYLIIGNVGNSGAVVCSSQPYNCKQEVRRPVVNEISIPLQFVDFKSSVENAATLLEVEQECIRIESTRSLVAYANGGLKTMSPESIMLVMLM